MPPAASPVFQFQLKLLEGQTSKNFTNSPQPKAMASDTAAAEVAATAEMPSAPAMTSGQVTSPVLAAAEPSVLASASLSVPCSTHQSVQAPGGWAARRVHGNERGE